MLWTLRRRWEFQIRHAFAQQFQVGVVEHEFEQVSVFTGKPLINIFLFVAPLAPLHIEEDEDGERQSKHCHDVIEGYRPLNPGHIIRVLEVHGCSGFSPAGRKPKWMSFSRIVVRVTPSQRAALAWLPSASWMARV
jgi:hypothetical protein